MCDYVTAFNNAGNGKVSHEKLQVLQVKELGAKYPLVRTIILLVPI